MNDKQNDLLTAELVKLLKGGSAHAHLKDALADLPFKLLGERPHGLPYSVWQLTEHIRIAQWDTLLFCKDAGHKSPKWPDDYWPKEPAPKDEATWKNSVKQINSNLDEFVELVKTGKVFDKVPNGNQTVLLEALQMADHTAYHIAEIIVIRRLLDAWKS